MKKIDKGIIYMVLSTLSYSIMPVLIRTLDKGNVPPASQVFLRYIPAFIFAVIYFIAKKGKFNFKEGNVLLLIVLGIFGYALTNLFFTYGILYTATGNALFIFYSFGIIAPIMAYLWLKDKFNKFNILSLVLTLIALFLLFRPNSFNTWQLGGMFALLAALAQSFYMVGRRKLKTYSSAMMLVCSTFLGILTVGAIALIREPDFYFAGGIAQMSVQTIVLTILFGFLNFTGWFFMSKGFETVKTTTGSVILLGENVLSVLFVFLFFTEVPTTLTIVGGFLIVAASIIVILKGDN